MTERNEEERRGKRNEERREKRNNSRKRTCKEGMGCMKASRYLKGQVLVSITRKGEKRVAGKRAEVKSVLVRKGSFTSRQGRREEGRKEGREEGSSVTHPVKTKKPKVQVSETNALIQVHRQNKEESRRKTIIRVK